MARLTKAMAIERDRRIFDHALEIFLVYPVEAVTIDVIAQSTGVERTSVHRNYSDRQGLYRQVVVQLLNGVSEKLSAAFPLGGSVRQTVVDCGHHLTKIFLDNSYREMLYLIVRDGQRKPWLVELYQERIVDVACIGLVGAIKRAGRAHGLILGIRDGAAEHFISQLESDTALQAIMPPSSRMCEADLPRIVERASADLIKGFYSV